MAIDLFFYWSYNSLFNWTNNTSYSNEYLDTYSPAFTSSSARGTAIWESTLLAVWKFLVSICSL